MSISKHRTLITRTTTTAMTVCGLVAGYFLGCALALQLAKSWLVQNAELAATQDDASFIEAKTVLTGIKDSPNSFCSESEIARFRELLFLSEYLKDLGRIRGGRIECSAIEGRLTRPLGQFKAQSAMQDGTIAYGNLVPIRDASLKRAGVQLGTAYAVLDAHLPPRIGPIALELRVNAQEAASQQVSGSSQGEIPVSSIDEAGRAEDTLFATRCSTLHQSCVTAFAPVSGALKSEIVIIAGITLIFGALGTLMGMIFSSVYTRSRDLCQQLRRAISTDGIQLVYQPIVNLGSSKIVGAEALARWNDEDGNPVSPEVFVKIAEENGFVGELTKTVIRGALRSFAHTLRNQPEFRLSVNVSGIDLVDPGFLPMLDDTLERTKVDPRSLVIEITERSTAENPVAMETIRELRRREHSVHIDDFGTGYSNLDRLLYLFADTIKIDKSFTRVVGTEAVTVVIIPQILAMAKSLNLDVIVEGVETERQACYFSSVQQKIYAQGWLYGRPITAEAFHGLLTGQSPAPTLDLAPASLMPAAQN